MKRTLPVFIAILFAAVCITDAQAQDSETRTGCTRGDCNNGYGTYLYENGDNYIGDWNNGKKEGKGIFNWADGSHYNGDWVAGVIQGMGIYTDADGKIFEGRFEKGGFAEAMKVEEETETTDDMPSLDDLDLMPALEDETPVVQEEQTYKAPEEKPEETKDFCLMTQIIMQDYLYNFGNLKGNTTIEDTTDDMAALDNFWAELGGEEKREVKKNLDLSQRWLSRFTFYNAKRTFIYDGTNDHNDDLAVLSSSKEGAWTWKCYLVFNVDEKTAETQYNAVVNLLNNCKFDFMLLIHESLEFESDETSYKSKATLWAPNYGIANMLGMEINEGYKNMLIEIDKSCYSKDNCYITFRCYEVIKD